MPHAPASRLGEDTTAIEEIMARPREGRRGSEIKDELGTTMNEHVAVFRDERGLEQAHETVHRLKEEAAKAYVDDRGSVFNQDDVAATHCRARCRSPNSWQVVMRWQ